MIRKIIKIDEDKCNGCSLCAKACHEGAIKMINGKANMIVYKKTFVIYSQKFSFLL